jgi:filamentous hemagglutinin
MADAVAPNRGTLNVTAANPLASERVAAEHMAGLGRNVELRDPVGTRAGGGTSDLLVDGVPYDVYTPTSANPNRIISAIAKKNDQATGIVVDLSNSPVTADQLGNVLGRVNGAGATNITDIVIIGN